MTKTQTSEIGPLRNDPRGIALLLAASLTVMAAATISPALPGLEQQFGDGPNAAYLIRALVPAPSLTVVFMAAFCGIVVDRIGRKPVLITGIALFALAGSAGLVLQDLGHLLASRLALGLALAMVMTAQSALVADYYAGAALHRMTGAQVAARNFGGFVFIMLAGGLASVATRLPFLVYALPAIFLPFFLKVIVEPARNKEAPNRAAHDSPAGWWMPIALLAGGQMIITIIFFTMPTQMPFFLSSQGYDNPALTGAVLGCLMIAGGIAATFYQRLRATIGDIANRIAAIALMATGFALLSGVPTVYAIFAGAAAIGAGYALAIPGFIAVALGVTPAQRRGTTAAMLTGSVFLGQFVSPFVSTPAIANWGWRGAGLGLAACLGMVALILMIAALRKRRT
ncbi:MFS transporter [Paracoccus albus]|uniref:MFS transporter n=1 Tax=Paracoccus albus TaxID=3017784 RepID=UPI0022F06D79|nr:MFS transporter [Paracoccus albus]WBU59059.1 MFS transporter [Paracoccus albus]